MSATSQAAEGFLHQATAQRWIDEVLPLALSLVAAGGVPVSPGVRVQARQVDSTDYAPHRSLMLTWPEHDGSDAVINHLFDCRAFLALYGLFLDELPDGARFRVVLSDGNRLKVAVTNDVLQVLAPGPTGEYSMIRHHALMFFAAHLWLPPADQALWTDLYHASLARAAERYRTSHTFGNARRYLGSLEHRAFAALDRLAEIAVPGKPLAADEDDVQLVMSYMHAANAAVAVLIDAFEALPQSRRFDWLVTQLAVHYRGEDYLVGEWAAMAGI